MNKQQIETLAENVVDWCAKSFGQSKFYDGLPLVDVDFERTTTYAEFDTVNNQIIVYARKNRSRSQVVKSVLHEYKHYLQSPSWLDRYMKLQFCLNFTNPYEIDAEKFAQDNWKRCLDDMYR